MLYSIVFHPSLSAEELNHDRNLISNWARQWKMLFNTDPNKQAVEIKFSQKQNKPILPCKSSNGKSSNKHPPSFKPPPPPLQ